MSAKQSFSDVGSGPWTALAADWSLIGSPLRPISEDLTRLQRLWLQSLPHGIAPLAVRVLLLGVTPEFAVFSWASSVSLTAVDRNPALIKSVWPGDGPRRRVTQGDWLHLPFADRTFDLIVCDNAPMLFVGESELTAFGRELRRVLANDGRCLMRTIDRPEAPESLAALATETAAGRIRGLDAMKVRFLAALQGDNPEHGVRLGDAWDQLQLVFPDFVGLAAHLGCRPDAIRTLEAYRDQETRYAFYSIQELTQAFSEFSLVLGLAGHYPLAERCPVFVLIPKA